MRVYMCMYICNIIVYLYHYLDYLQHIKRTVADIKFDVNLLTEQNHLILNKLNLNTFNQRRESRSPTPNDELSELSFPLRSVEKVEFLQHLLISNEGLKERTVSKRIHTFVLYRFFK